MMKSELNKVESGALVQVSSTQTAFDSIKHYPNYMSPSKRISPSKSRTLSGQELEYPWNQLKARIQSLEDEPVTDESEIMRELDQTIQSIIEEAEQAENQQDQILEGELQVQQTHDLGREGEAEDVGYATPSKRLKSTLSKSIKLIVEKKIAEKLVPVQDVSLPKNKTERDQKDFHTRKSKEVRKLQYVSSLSREQSSRRSRNKLASEEAATEGIKKSSAKKSSSKNLFRSDSKKLFIMEQTDQKKYDAVKKSSKSRSKKYVDYLQSQSEKSDQASSRKPQKNIDYIKVVSSKNDGDSSRAFESFNSNHKAQKKLGIKERIQKLATQLSQNPTMTKKEKLGIIYELENLLNQELEEMKIGKSQLIRTDPQEQHPIWIRHNNTIYPAMLRCSNGFKVNQQDVDLLEIREGDVVTVEINETQNTTKKKESRWAARNLPFKLCGMIKKPENSELASNLDFVIDDGQGCIYPAIIYLREGDSYDYVEAPRSMQPHAHEFQSTPKAQDDANSMKDLTEDHTKSLKEFQEFEHRVQTNEEESEKNQIGHQEKHSKNDLSGVESSKSIVSVERLQLNKIYSMVDDISLLQHKDLAGSKDSVISEAQKHQPETLAKFQSEIGNNSIEYASASDRSKDGFKPEPVRDYFMQILEPQVVHIV